LRAAAARGTTSAASAFSSMPLPAAVAVLVETFRNNEADYAHHEFKETQLRRQFLDPLFAALGWDMSNTAGYAEAYKEVVHEDAIRVRDETKAPDYAFRIGGQRKFFVEAKKPSVNIKDDPAPALQLRRYSWTVGLSLGILTNFQEISIYDTRIRPRAADKAGTARLFCWRYTDLPEKWDEFAGIFSKDAILKGAFDRFAESKFGKRGTSKFDDEFLSDIEKWRDLLARNIALRNPALSQRELNFSVQRILDRIIFLRIAEAHDIEPFGQLNKTLAASAGGAVEEDPAVYGMLAEPAAAYHARRQTIYPRLREIFERADFRYNSGIFHFENEKDRSESPDKLTLTLSVDDAPLRQIIGALYYPESPYAFDYIEADILGSIYERFLGKTIRLTDGHRAVVEEKPEVRKAGGVYYTPKYIVDYIVQQTLGPLLKNKTPAQAEKIKVLDPACGSGSFLIGAYQHLLDWHLQYYIDHDPQKWARKKNPPVYETSPTADGTGKGKSNWQLTTAERKRILINNIHGVDIDVQAVEVTKLALLLKILEGEARELQGLQTDFYRVLPDLGKNIHCGNSLIGHDFYQQLALPDLSEDDKYRINTFEWKDAFPEIIKSGGFDAVIGNPPYVRIQTIQETQPASVAYLAGRYAAAAKGNYDLYVCFIEKALTLLNPDGRLGYIVPHKFFNTEYGEALRALIARGRHLAGIIHFGHQQIFNGATTYTAILNLTRAANTRFTFTRVSDLAAWLENKPGDTARISCKSVTAAPWNFAANKTEALLKNMAEGKPRLGELAELFVGLQTDADDIFIVEEIRREGANVLCRSKSTGQEHWFENAHLKKFLKGSLNIRRYHFSDVTKRLIFPYQTKNGRSELISETEYLKQFPKTWAYLKLNESLLSKRAGGKNAPLWHGYVYKKNHLRFEQPKLLVPSIATGSCFTSDPDGEYYFVGSGGGGGGGYGIVVKTPMRITPHSLLALLNSSLLSNWLRAASTPFRGGYYAFNKQYIENAPIVIPSSSDQKKLAVLAENMLSLHQRLAAAKIPHDQTRLQREITATDRRIDALVYQLYGLTEPEIALVEQAAA
jgi:hypothetical protein